MPRWSRSRSSASRWPPSSTASSRLPFPGAGTAGCEETQKSLDSIGSHQGGASVGCRTEKSVEADGATQARKHVRAVLVAADIAETSLWTQAAHTDLSLDAKYAGSLAEALALLEERNVDVAVVSSGVADGSYRDLLRPLQPGPERRPVIVAGAL